MLSSGLLKLKFATFIGDTEKDSILIDISLDSSSTMPPEKITPANRIKVKGVITCDYLVYSLPDQMADKFCAITEVHEGRQSSRMKDLFDIVIYVTNETFGFGEVRNAVMNECSARKMEIPASFSSPSSWNERFKSFALKNGMVSEFANFKSANNLAKSFFDPVLTEELHPNSCWNPSALKWRVGRF